MKNRPDNVKAAILVEQNQPLVVDNIELPERLFPGQVLVKVECSGICGSQMKFVKRSIQRIHKFICGSQMRFVVHK